MLRRAQVTAPVGGVINPYQGSRNKSISPDDITHSFALLGVYDLPFGPGKRWLNNSGILGQIVGGWTLASSIKLVSGMPLFFRDSTVCGVPIAISGPVHSGPCTRRESSDSILERFQRKPASI